MDRYEQYGHKRLAVGSGYGTMDFIAQRATAIILAVYSVLFLLAALFTVNDYASWINLFTFTWFGFPTAKISASLAFLALAYHAWVGVRDIWMDYIKSTGLRMALQTVTVLWLVACIVYFTQIIWSL